MMSTRDQRANDQAEGDNGSSTQFLDDARAVYRGIGIALAVLLVIVATGFLYWWLTRTTTEEIDALINANLQPGASTEEIFAFLDAERFAYVHEVDRAGDHGVLRRAGYHEDTQVVGALARNTSQAFITTGDIEIFFILDDQQRLKEHYLNGIFTGL